MRTSTITRSTTVVFLVCLLGCTTTPYQKRGVRGGYESNWLDATTASVVFIGNEYTTRERVEGSLLYRCAELASQSGYAYFVVQHAETQVRQKSYRVPTMTASNATSDTRAVAYGAAQATGNAGATFWYTSFEATAVIELCSEPQAQPDRTFRVADVLEDLESIVK